jgi:hypothetical protein
MADSDSGEHTHTPATTESPSSPATTLSPNSPTVIRDRLLLLGQKHQQQQAVFRIHRILVFLGLLDPDPLVRGMDPDPDPSIISKYSKKNLISTLL